MFKVASPNPSLPSSSVASIASSSIGSSPPTTVNGFDASSTVSHSFPLLHSSIPLLSHSDSLIRTSSETVLLHILKLQTPALPAYLAVHTKPLWISLVKRLRVHISHLHSLIKHPELHSDSMLSSTLHDVIDMCFFIADVLEADNVDVNKVVEGVLFEQCILVWWCVLAVCGWGSAIDEAEGRGERRGRMVSGRRGLPRKREALLRKQISEHELHTHGKVSDHQGTSSPSKPSSSPSILRSPTRDSRRKGVFSRHIIYSLLSTFLILFPTSPLISKLLAIMFVPHPFQVLVPRIVVKTLSEEDRVKEARRERRMERERERKELEREKRKREEEEKRKVELKLRKKSNIIKLSKEAGISPSPPHGDEEEAKEAKEDQGERSSSVSIRLKSGAAVKYCGGCVDA
ncbi:CLEC16A/TT9 like protein [Aduncisulcus paluster]|uniref:CLEC16A/TT9 like protein n=1 Tax=Aduncisulcus paluster TaxID=2918883 RepID=A0ABQ5KUF3_9EUKA|nr:CLEC16A/TT9 like protein [Aduncisulcus paluster]